MVDKYIDTHACIGLDSKWKEYILSMVLISRRSNTTGQKKGAPLDHQQSLQGSLRHIPTFLVILCSIQAGIILIICLVVVARSFPSQPAETPPVHPTITPGKTTPTTRPQSIHPALIKIGEYIIAVTILPDLMYLSDANVQKAASGSPVRIYALSTG